MNDHNDAVGVATIQDPWRQDDLRERVARGEALVCCDCPDFEGVPSLNGRCPRCDDNEFRLGMPPCTQDIIDAAVQTALGYSTTEKIRHKVQTSRDASAFDNRTFRGWKGFRIQVITISRRTLPWRALPLLWVMKSGDLSDDFQGTRLPLVAEDDDTEQGIVLLLLWRKGEPGYLRGQWVGQLRRYQWDISDAAQLAHLPQERREVWWAALREARKRGPRLGSRKCFESYEAFENACRNLVTPEGWKAALKSPRTSPSEKAAMWEDTITGKMTQKTLATALNVSQPALSRALKEYERSNHLTWRDWQRRIASWAKLCGEAVEENY